MQPEHTIMRAAARALRTLRTLRALRTLCSAGCAYNRALAAPQIVQADAILASNTSSISITRIGAATTRAHAVVGMHFMNPAPRMQLVEIIRGMATSDQASF